MSIEYFICEVCNHPCHIVIEDSSDYETIGGVMIKNSRCLFENSSISQWKRVKKVEERFNFIRDPLKEVFI